MEAEERASAVRAGQLGRLEALTEARLADLGLEDLLVELLDRVRELLSADTAAVLLLDRSGQSLVATAARGIEEAWFAKAPVFRWAAVSQVASPRAKSR